MNSPLAQDLDPSLQSLGRETVTRSSPVTWCTTFDPSSLWFRPYGVKVGLGHLVGGGGAGGLGAGEEVESEVTAVFGPFVMLFGQDGSDEPDEDLIDLVAISRRATVDADLQQQALAREAVRRNVELPTAFDVPVHRLWERGYRAEARCAVGRTL